MSMRITKLFTGKILTLVIAFIVFQCVTPKLMAIPAFARKYKTACATCHNNWPELNDFGRAFKINGFKFPKDDDQFVKDPPLMLGASAQKEVFPNSIYPGELPILPIAFRYSGFFTYNTPAPTQVVSPPGPSTTLFTPNTFTIISAGSFGPSIAFWIDNDISTGGSGAAGGLGDGYIKANDFLGHYLHVPVNDLNVRFGEFELDVPFSQARTINQSNYAIIAETAPNNPMTLASPQTGIEIGGYPRRGYTWWSIAVDDGENTVYGTASPSVGHNRKDVYVHLAQRFDLERDPAVRKEVQAAGPTGVRDHTSLRFDGFAYLGKNELNQAGSTTAGLPAFYQPFYRAGGAFDYKFRDKFELWGLYEHAHDAQRVLNADSSAYVRATPVTFSGGFLEAQYWLYPWLIGLVRYDGVNSPTDHAAGVSRYDTRSSYSPALHIIVRPNIKLEAQYTFNYEQPVPGASTFYRANSFLTGVDFVY